MAENYSQELQQENIQTEVPKVEETLQAETTVSSTNGDDPPYKKLWKGLVDEGLYSGNFEDFQKKYSTSQEIEKLHKGLIEENLYSKGVDDFYTQYFPELKKKDIQSPGQNLQNGGQAGTSPAQSPSQSPSTSQKPKVETDIVRKTGDWNTFQNEQPINSDGTPTIGENEPTDEISLALNAKKYKDKTIEIVGKNANDISTKHISGMKGESNAFDVYYNKQMQSQYEQKLREGGVDEKGQEEIINELKGIPDEVFERKYTIESGEEVKPYNKQFLSTIRKENYPYYINRVNAIKNDYNLEKEGDKKASNQLANAWNETGMSQLDNFNSTEPEAVVNNLNALNDYTTQATGIISNASSKTTTGFKSTDESLSNLQQGAGAYIYTNVTPDTAKDYLTTKVSINGLEPKYNQQDVSSIISGQPAVPKQDLDEYTLSSIKSKLDPNSVVDQMVFNVYSQKVALEDAFQSATSIEEAAMNYRKSIDPEFNAQITALEGNVNKSTIGETVDSFLSDPAVLEYVKKQPELYGKLLESKMKFNKDFPEFAKSKLLQKIGSEYQKDYANWFANNPTTDKLDIVVDKLLKEGKISEEDVNTYKTEIVPKQQWFWKTVRGLTTPIGGSEWFKRDVVPTADFVSGLTSGIYGTLKNVAGTIEQGMGYVPILGAVTDQVFSDKAVIDRALADRTIAQVDPVGTAGTMYQIGNITGFAATLALMGIPAGAMGLGAESTHMLTTALAFYGENKKEALLKIPGNTFADNVQRQLLTGSNTAVDLYLTKFLDINKISKGALSLLKKDVSDVIGKLRTGSITQAKAGEEVWGKIKDFGVRFGANSMKNATVMNSFTAAHDAVYKLFNAGGKEFPEITEEYINNFIPTLKSTVLLNLFASVKPGEKITVGKTLFDMAKNPDYYREMINKKYGDNPKLKAEKEDLLNNLDEVIAINNNYSDPIFKDLTEAQRQKILLLRMQANIYAEKATSTQDPTASKGFLDKSNELSKQIEVITKGKDKASEHKIELVSKTSPTEQLPEYAINGKEVTEKEWLNAVKNNLDVEIDYNGDNEQYHQMVRDIGGTTREWYEYEDAIPEVKAEVEKLTTQIKAGGKDSQTAQEELERLKADPKQYFVDKNNTETVFKIEEYDKKNEGGVSGVVGEGQTSQQVQSVEGAGTEATGTGGVLQTPGVEGEGEGVGKKVGEVTPEEKDLEDRRINEIGLQPLRSLSTSKEQYEKDLAAWEKNKKEVNVKFDAELKALKEKQAQVPQQKTVEQLRAEEQAEYDAMPNPKDKAKRQEIYDKYDKLITPLLKEGEGEVKAEVPQQKLEEGTTIELPPQVKGGVPRQMIYKDGVWQQQVGGQTTKVSENIQKQAQAQFESSQPATPEYSRNVSVLITPATIRSFNDLTARMKKLSLAYDDLVKSMDKNPSEKKLKQIKALESQILEQAKKEIAESVAKVNGVEVKFGNDNMGSWQGKAEPSINMTLKISANADTKAISDIINDFGERYSQDAIILELNSEYHNDIQSGKKNVKLSEFEGNFMYYPKFVYNFKSKLSAKQRAALSNALKKEGIEEFTLGDDRLEISVIKYLSESEQSLTNEEQFKLKEDDYKQKGESAAKAISDSLGNVGIFTFNINHKKSKYIGGEESGTDKQQRKYDRSDVFEDITEGLKKTQESAKELAQLRNKQIELQKQGKKLSPEESSRLEELMASVVPIIEETLEGKEKQFQEAKNEVESIAEKVMKSISGFVSKFPAKRPSRGAIKVARWYSAFTEKLGDAARVNLIVSDNVSADKVFNKINKEHGNVADAELRNVNEATDLGYPKRLIEIRTSNGTIAEIQVMTPKGYLAKDGVKEFPKDKQDIAKKELQEVRDKLGWDIPDGLGHYLYEINRDLNISESLRNKAKELSIKYYDAFLNTNSKLSQAEFTKEISDFKKQVDAADKSSWDKGNSGKSPETLNTYLETQKPELVVPEPIKIKPKTTDKLLKFANKHITEPIKKFSKKLVGKEDKEVLTSQEDKESQIVDEMNSMNLVNHGVDLSSNLTTKEKIDVEELNSRLDNPLETVNWEQFDGIPFTFTISDQLRTGDVTNPNTGEVITDLKGGIGFNGTEGNENNAWANTTPKEAESMLKRAKSVYENNKPLFEKLWAEGKLPDGHIPVAVVKMGEGSILSNEAVFRVGIQNIETLPKANRKKAVSALATSMKNKIDAETKSIKRGVDKEGNPYTENTIKLKKKTIAQCQKILNAIKENKYEDIVDILKDKENFSLPEKVLIANEVFYGSPTTIGEKEIDISKSKPNTLVSKVLIGNKNPALINLGKITDLLTEPSMKNVPNMHIVSIVGVDVKNPEATKVNHNNYKHGVKGKSIGILEQPIHMKDAFGEAYGSALAQVTKNEAKNASVTEKQALTGGIPVQSGLTNKVLQSAIAKSNLDAVDKLSGFLRQAFPKTTFFTSQEAWDEAMSDPSIKKELKDGEVVYAFTTDGNVFINPKLKTTKATLHETGHIWTSFVKENNPALHNKGLDLVTGTKEHQEAMKEYGDTELAREEALMELMSTKGESIVNAAQKAKFQEWLLSVYKYIAQTFKSLQGLTPEQIGDVTLDKFIEGMLADILAGKELSTKKVKGETKFSKEGAPQSDKLSDMVDIVKDLVEEGHDLNDITKIVTRALNDNSQATKDLISEAHTEATKPSGTSGGAEVPPAGETKKTAPEEDPEMTKMANAVNDAFVEGRFGTDVLDNIIAKLQDTDTARIYNTVKQKIKSGVITTKEVRDKIITTKEGSEADQAVLMYDLAELKGKEAGLMNEMINESDPAKQAEIAKKIMDVQNEMQENALANRYLGRTASSIFRLRQLWVNKGMDLATMEKQYMSSKGVKSLTPEQSKEIKEAYNKIAETKAKLEKAKEEVDALIQENEKIKAENEKLKELKEQSAAKEKEDRNKKAAEKITASQERINKAKANLKNLRGDMNVGVNPRVAIEIGKIAAEKFYQGAVKLDVLVKEVLDDVKDIFPDWTENDVRDHLFPNLKNASKYFTEEKDYTSSKKELKDKINQYKALQSEYAKTLFEWQKERRTDLMDKRPWSEKLADRIYQWQRFAVLSYPTTFVKLAAVVGYNLLLKPFKFGYQKVIANIAKAISKDFSGKMGVYGDPSLKAMAKYYSEFIRNFSIANLKEQFSGIDTKEILYGDKFMFDEWAAGKGLLEMPGRSHGYIKSFVKNPEFQFAHEILIGQAMTKMAEIGKKMENEKKKIEYIFEDEKLLTRAIDDLPNELYEKISDLTGENNSVGMAGAYSRMGDSISRQIEDIIVNEKTKKIKAEYDKYDVTNEEVLMRINKLSLEHGKDAILMGDNKTVDKFRELTKGSGAASTFLKTEAPIVKIPLNYINRALLTKYGLMQAITGKSFGAESTQHPSVAKLIFKGTKGLTEAQGQALSKAIMYGSMGATMFALGYFNKDKVKLNEDGSIDIGGMHISKNLIHVPEFESFFSGAETAHKFKDEKSKFNWIESFLLSDMEILKKNPFLNMLEYGLVGNLINTLTDKRMKDESKIKLLEDAANNKVINIAVPGFSKQLAQWMDTEEGKGIHPMGTPIKRKPQGDWGERFVQSLEMAIPGLRQLVPTGEGKKIFDEKQIAETGILKRYQKLGVDFKEVPAADKLGTDEPLTPEQYDKFVEAYQKEIKMQLLELADKEFQQTVQVESDGEMESVPVEGTEGSNIGMLSKKFSEKELEKEKENKDYKKESALQNKVDEILSSAKNKVLIRLKYKKPTKSWVEY